jgi:hypothetical protein
MTNTAGITRIVWSRTARREYPRWIVERDGSMHKTLHDAQMHMWKLQLGMA